MPIYEYQCSKCGTIEIMQKITDKALGRCPQCKGRVKKLISHTSFQLKGTGWYLTDYARKDSAPKETKGSNGEGKGESSPPAEKPSGDKAEAKPAASTAKPASSGSSAD